MKNIIKFNLLALILLIFNLKNVQSQPLPVKIGEIQGNYLIITKNLTDIKIQWETFMALGQDNVDLDTTTFEILYDVLDTTYLLLGSNTARTIKCTVLLNPHLNGDLYEMANNDGGATSVTCKGFSSGCSPRRKKNGDGYCTWCLGNCEKTETLSQNLVFF